MTTKHRTYCRLCEAGCGILVDVADDGTVEKVRPDNDPLTPLTITLLISPEDITEVLS